MARASPLQARGCAEPPAGRRRPAPLPRLRRLDGLRLRALQEIEHRLAALEGLELGGPLAALLEADLELAPLERVNPHERLVLGHQVEVFGLLARVDLERT